MCYRNCHTNFINKFVASTTINELNDDNKLTYYGAASHHARKHATLEYERAGWNIAIRIFTGRFIADSMLLLNALWRRQIQIAKKIWNFQNLRCNKAGRIFVRNIKRKVR